MPFPNSAAAQPWGAGVAWVGPEQILYVTCNCGALACAANPMGYPPSHGADCPMCPPQERWLKLRIRELEAELQRVKTGG